MDPSPDEEKDRGRSPIDTDTMDHSPGYVSSMDHSPVLPEEGAIWMLTCPTRTGYGMSSLNDYGMATSRELLGSDHVL